MNKVLFSGVAVLLFASQSFAQERLINGRIKDAVNGEPLEGVTISYHRGGMHAHSGADGRFTIAVTTLPDTLLATRAGYEDYRKVMTASTDSLLIFLQPKAAQLSEVVINSNRFRTNIMQVDLNRTPVNTAQDLLRKVPGLFIAQHAGGGKAEQIFLRGFDNDHGTDIRVSVDNLPVNMVSHAHGQGYADLHFVIPETVRDIDFGKGAYYANKGDFNTSGYVNFETYDRLENSLFKVEGGSFNTVRAVTMLNLLNKNVQDKSAYVAGEFNYTDGPFDIKQGFNRINVFAKYNQWINSRQYINLQASAFTSGWNASGQIPERAVAQGLISRWGSIDPTEGGNTSRNNLSLTYRYLISDHQDWESLVYFFRYKFNLYSDFTFFLNDPVYGDEIQQVDDRSVYGFENTYRQRFQKGASSFLWTSGAGLRLDDIHNLELNHVYHRDTLLNRLSHISAVETGLHAYSSLEWRTGKWMVNPALRVDHFIFNLHDRLQPVPAGQSAGATRISPKLNFSYAASNNLQVYLKNGMGFHSNDIRVVVAQNGKDILPFSAGSDLGVIWRPVSNLIVQPALWYTYLQQEFVYVGDEAVVEPSGKTVRLGADLGLRYQPAKWLYVDADVNYAHARFEDEPEGQNYIPLAPSLTSTGGVAVKLNGFSANLRYRYMKDRPAIEDNSIIAKGYFVNDLLLAYGKKAWEVTVQVQNLFDTQWNEAQFETETRLKNEPVPVSELHFTPGTPFYLKAGVSIRL